MSARNSFLGEFPHPNDRLCQSTVQSFISCIYQDLAGCSFGPYCSTLCGMLAHFFDEPHYPYFRSQSSIIFSLLPMSSAMSSEIICFSDFLFRICANERGQGLVQVHLKGTHHHPLAWSSPGPSVSTCKPITLCTSVSTLTSRYLKEVPKENPNTILVKAVEKS